jgi:putative PIN family toxin of toxin-antitoxin system
MKVVVDTSVWISGLISPDSSAATVIRLLYEERFDLLYNNECLLELSEVSSRKKFMKLIASQQARALVTLIQQKGTKIRLSKRAETQDPKVITCSSWHSLVRLIFAIKKLLYSLECQVHLKLYGFFFVFLLTLE